MPNPSSHFEDFHLSKVYVHNRHVNSHLKKVTRHVTRNPNHRISADNSRNLPNLVSRHPTTLPLTTMAAAISALNAKIRSQPVLNYVCSTRTYSTHPMAPVPRVCPHQHHHRHPTPVKPLPLTLFPPPKPQISGAPSRTSASRSRRSWTRRKTRTCASPLPFPGSVAQTAAAHDPCTCPPAPSASYLLQGSELMRYSVHQYLRQDDAGPDALLRDVHALRPRGDAEELPAVRVPRGEFQRAADAGVAVFELLAVRMTFVTLVLGLAGLS